jgi:drug/metabolite transporter (DMT)-like permease
VRQASLIWPGVPLALAAAILFGASTPAAKVLLGGVDPWLLAGLLYLGSGLGLGLFALGRAGLGLEQGEARIGARDLPWLALVVLAGGVAAPVLLMVGLTQVSAASASLLLNLEGLATMGIAWLAFHEHLDRRIFLGAMAILLGAALLRFQSGAQSWGWGTLAIVAACVCWGIDNNLTRKLSFSDPVHLTLTKGLAAGLVNLVLARFVAHAAWPEARVVAASLLVGLLGYGVSLVLFTHALRHLGTARTAAYFSTAPFIGGVLAILLLHEPAQWQFWLAAVLMGSGVAVHLIERHEHGHIHDATTHTHRHRHDLHHQHAHGPNDPPGEPHVHEHEHEALEHSHPHLPDAHHRHRHRGGTVPN